MSSSSGGVVINDTAVGVVVVVMAVSLEASSSPDTHLADDILCDNIGNYDCYEAMDEDPSPEVEVGSPNKRRCTAGDHPLLSWMDHQELFLLEMLHHDGRGDDISSTFCNTCGITVGSYRCKDCFMSRLSCQMCIVAAHAYSPVHRVEACQVLKPQDQAMSKEVQGDGIQLGLNHQTNVV
ncbi:hypothetical protein EV702DRAFT_1042493 [Suillus placidus]|uniref:Uncharacterized protein n=1 Tax=Suillus placidus TaxID=48579 RepID=A0A9P7D5U4_9AGAM|nr:hypothetical protein EV702DRAFT_1042493 [Suillus placidus]